MSSITRIVHLADIHIRKATTRNEEYEGVFKNLIDSLTNQKPHRIVIVGDLVHENLNLQPEQIILVSRFLNQLADIAPVRITRGNHDYQASNSKRIDSVGGIVKIINNPNITYYDKTGFYVDDNITWAVWHHGEKNNNPWKTKEGKSIIVNKDLNKTYIDLFHDPISGCKSTTGFEMKSKSYYKISDFKGDYSLFGDIHKQQYLNNEKTKFYAGSLISQDFSEGDDNFHGYLLWNIKDETVKEIIIPNEYSFKNIKITPYIDFDDLDIEILNPTKYMKVRFVWMTLPQVRNKDNERKVIEYIKSKYQNLTISHKNEFIENEKIDINENITLLNVTDKAVQHEIFKEFLNKIGTDAQLINDVIALDEEILKEIELFEDRTIEWNVIKFGGKNFMSYGNLDIDWRDKDGLFQIVGKNANGKTTILKILSYILFGKTLETDSRMKYGDMRFINNRNDATYTEAYLVLEANGEFFGIKRKTELTKSRSGEITGAPTTLSYYALATPDDEMNDISAIEKLDEDRRIKTQKNIDSIIGSYDNFMRIVMTTSDTLNRILSNDMSTFIDSLLYDSGLDIFDKKLDGLKTYQKRVNEKSRINCNVELTTTQNSTLTQEITSLQSEITEIESVKLPDIQTRIQTGRTYVETLTKKLYKIDPEIYNLDVDIAKEDISHHQKNIIEINAREMILRQSINGLKASYDEEKLNGLIVKRDEHKQTVYDKKFLIKEQERTKSDYQHQIEIINGKIFTLKRDGKTKKDEITTLKESKTCPTCGQLMTAEHQAHVDEKIKRIEAEMFEIAKQIKGHENDIETDWKPAIKKCEDDILVINEEIVKLGLDMETILNEIGTLTNDKNDVEKRKKLQDELELIPTKVQNEELKTSILNQKVVNYENSLKQIEENHKIEKGIKAAKEKVEQLEYEETSFKEDVFIRKTSIGEKELRIKNGLLLIQEFKLQEYQDNVMMMYKKCVHRDGIPRQMLSNYIIPKINLTLENILSVAPFKVWLDVDDLRPKLAYYDRATAIIDCIGASGKERTFSSVVLKFALNQINVKAKPTIFLLDEVMGKLDDNSVEEFIEILQLIKSNMKKVLVIEHVREINPDYLIKVELNEEGISSVVLE